MVDFVNNVRCFVNYAIFCELCDRMRSEVDCAKSHHRVISEGLWLSIECTLVLSQSFHCNGYQEIHVLTKIILF